MHVNHRVRKNISTPKHFNASSILFSRCQAIFCLCLFVGFFLVVYFFSFNDIFCLPRKTKGLGGGFNLKIGQTLVYALMTITIYVDAPKFNSFISVQLPDFKPLNR